MPPDVEALWNFDRPAESEVRFRTALAGSTGDDALVLRTQIARALGLQGKFVEAYRELDALTRLLNVAGPEPRVRAVLERGRVHRSAGDPASARPLFLEAFELAQATDLPVLAADALHMVPLVEPALEGRIEWSHRFLAHVRAATNPKVRAWEASALNNLGVALNEAGRHHEALEVFRDALVLRERAGRIDPIRVAQWMIAHTLRLLGRIDEALASQLELEALWNAAGETDAYVLEELALLYEEKAQPAEAARYRELHRKALAS